MPSIILPDMFTATTLTQSINTLPRIPTKAGALGIFEEEGVPTTSVTFEENMGRLILIPNHSRNSDPQSIKSEKRVRRVFATSHLPTTSQVLPDEIQNFGSFGDDTGSDYQATVLNNRLQSMQNSLEATREWHRIGALRGKILDADGGILYDLFQEFGVSQKKMRVKFKDANTQVRTELLNAKRFAENKLGGSMVSGFKAFCGAEFFDALTTHPSVEKAFANYQEASDRLGGDMRDGFVFGGIEFIEYNIQVSGRDFIPSNIAQVFPVGPGLYKMFNAPANYNETVNTLGLPFYAKSEERKMGKGWDLEAQSNPLAMCLRPESLVEISISE